MKTVISSTLLITALMALLSGNIALAQDKNVVVRVASLKIDSSQLETYKAALREEIETSVRVEPGVLSLYAVADAAHPSHITIMEVYANQAAYKAHIETPHFKKYKTATMKMVKSLELMETIPILLGKK